MNPKLSVLVPNFNYGKYLPQAIESVLAQNYEDYEFLIVDNASTDDSRDVIESFAAQDRRVRPVFNHTNIGGVQNWNLCLELARGTYAKFVFSDDRLADPQALSKMVDALDRNPDVSLVAGATRVVEHDSQERAVRDPFGSSFVRNGLDIAVLCLTQNSNFLGEPSVAMFRRATATRGFTLEYRYVADLEMWAHILKQGHFAYIAEPLTDFRDHPDRPASTATNDLVKDEYARLLAQYLDEPWFQERLTARHLFDALHSSRRRHGRQPDTAGLDERLSAELGLSRYAACWLQYRIERLLLPRRTRRARRIPRPAPG
jgi:glycosyltransferase involved in cell wall biosynthesis